MPVDAEGFLEGQFVFVVFVIGSEGLVGDEETARSGVSQLGESKVVELIKGKAPYEPPLPEIIVRYRAADGVTGAEDAELAGRLQFPWKNPTRSSPNVPCKRSSIPARKVTTAYFPNHSSPK